MFLILTHIYFEPLDCFCEHSLPELACDLKYNLVHALKRLFFIKLHRRLTLNDMLDICYLTIVFTFCYNAMKI